MSNALGVSAVTSTLRSVLDRGTRDNPAGTAVTTRPPDRARGAGSGNQLNVFLYHTSLNAAWRNQDMPGQVKPGEAGVPPLPLTLSYLLTAYGDGDEDELGHQVLGRAMSILHDTPVLSPADIEMAIGTEEFGRHDVHLQVEALRITYEPLTLDEMSKLWTIFQTQYRISAAYQVSVLLIESRRAARTPLPVLRQGDTDRGPIARTGLTPPTPTLVAVEAPHAGAAVELGEVLTLRGHHLRGVSQVVLRHQGIDARHELPPLPGGTDHQQRVQLPDDAVVAAAWAAGVYTVTAELSPPTESGEHPRTTNGLPVALAPRIEHIAIGPISHDPDGRASFVATISFAPERRIEQRAVLLFGDRELMPEPPPDSTAPTGTLAFAAEGIAAGEHYLRLRIAGIDSTIVDRSATPLAFDDAVRVVIP